MGRPPAPLSDPYDRELADNVHPPGWKNPEPAACYNLVVIGAGTAGLVTAAIAAGLGAKVALIERRLFGGDCLNTGCVPSKAVIRAARAAHDARSSAEYGVLCGKDVTIDFSRTMERMRRIRAGISAHDSVKRFSRELEVDVFLGDARFAGPDSVEVSGDRLRFRKAAICTGSRPAVPSVPGLDDSGYLTNETVFELTELPARLAVLGGGPMGCELAQAFARLGSRVTLIERAGQLLPKEDPDAADIVRRALERDGVRVLLQTEVAGAVTRGAETILAVRADGKSSETGADRILAATGRIPSVAGLGLEKAGIAYDLRSGVMVNDFLRTSNRNVYAAGDVCSPYRYTHAADAMARIVVANALFPSRQRLSSLVIPRCTFTDPQVAHTGMNETEASERGFDFVALTVPLTDVDRAVLEGESSGFARVLLKKGTDRILGSTIVAGRAGEMIAEMTLAMTAGIGLSGIGRTVHPYPTVSEALKKLADLHRRTKLTPGLQRIVKLWLKWRRGR